MTALQHKMYISFLFLIGIVTVFLLTSFGYGYYLTPFSEKYFNSLHSTLKPSGIIGHGVGIIGTLMMIFGVAIYMLRKRRIILGNVGKLKYWLEFHIFLCTLGPLLVMYHTTFKIGGIVAISFWSMVAVVLSGFAGRFIYVRIPRTLEGNELSLKEIDNLNGELSLKLSDEYNVPGNIISKINELTSSINFMKIDSTAILKKIYTDFNDARKVKKQIHKHLKDELHLTRRQLNSVIKICDMKLNLVRRIGFLKLFHRLFNYWHVAHLPLALVMFLIMIIHVGVTLLFGYKWIF